MTKLADLLRARLVADPRALIGALEISHDRILLTFGGIGELPRIVLGIEDDAVTLLHPAPEPEDPAADLSGLARSEGGGQTAVGGQDAGGAAGDTGGGSDGSGGASGGPEQPALIDPKAHNLAALKAMAEKAGVTVAGDATKKQIADALNAAAAAK